MSAFDDADAVRRAVDGAVSRRQVLERLGFAPARKNYQRLASVAALLEIELPPLRATGPRKGERGALADEERLRSLSAKGTSLDEILRDVGLAASSSNRHRLAAKLASMGIATKLPLHRSRYPTENLARLTAVEVEALDRAARHTNASGDMAELAAAACLRRLGATVSFPVGHACRYDLVADLGGQLFRVQVKTGHLTRGCIIANAKTTSPGQPTRKYQSCEVDVIVIYCPALGSVYWVPLADVNGANHVTLRVDEPTNGQRVKVKSAFDYYIGQV